MQVEIWSDVVCPWCWIGKRRCEAALTGFEHRADVEVVYRSFELDPTAARGVTTPTVEILASRYGMSPEQARDAQRSMVERAAADGLEFHIDGQLTGSTRDAHRLIHLAGDRGLRTEAYERLHAAYFTEQRSIFDRESLVALAEEIGLDRAEAGQVLDGDAYDDAVQADEDLAREFGVSGVPFFVIDRRYAVSGAQPAELIRSAIEQAWAERVTVGG